MHALVPMAQHLIMTWATYTPLITYTYIYIIYIYTYICILTNIWVLSVLSEQHNIIIIYIYI